MKPSQFVDGILVLTALTATTFLGLSYFRSAPASPAPTDAATLRAAVEGSELPLLEVIDADGSTSHLELGPDGTTRFILVFRSDCSFCEQSVPLWNKFIGEFDPDIEVMAVNSESVRVAEEWLAINQVRYNRLAVAVSAAEMIGQWGISVVPVTLLVRGSRVLVAEFGVFRSTSYERFRESLDMNLDDDS